MGKVSFQNKQNEFFLSLKKSVDNYFTEKGISKTGNWRLYLKAAILMPLAVIIYVSLLFLTLPAWAGIALAVLLGFCLASIGFNIMHDACHGSYSGKKWVNNVLGLTINAIGGNAFFWKQKHNVLHHTYTNIEGADDDIAQSKYLRQSPTQPWMPLHRYQHIYLTLAYSLMLFVWVGFKDFNRYFTGKIHNTPLQPMDTKEHITFWVSKVFYLAVYVILPIYMVGFWAWVIGFLAMGLTTGILLSYVFQLAHAVEGPEFDAVGIDDKMMETAWAVHQVKTTANFSQKNKIISWFVGGLNFQVEHHLFPRISHIHYPAISKIVKQHCERFQLPYHSFPSVWKAVVSHIKTMKRLGQMTT